MYNINAIRSIIPENVEDFVELYKIFRNPPYEEDWTDDEIYAQYKDLYKNGYVHGYYCEGECIGLVTFREMRLEDGHPVHYSDSEKVAYLADIIVLPEFRRRGVGTRLMENALDTLKYNDFTKVYMKTLEIGKSMSYGIAIKLGFKLIEGVTSIDTMKRTSATRKESDIKIYLDREL